MNAKQIRAKARQNLRNTWAVSIAVAAVAILLGGLIQGSSFLPNFERTFSSPFLSSLNRLSQEGIRVGRLTLNIQDGAIVVVAFFFGGVIQLGHARFLLNQHDGQEVHFSDLFSQMGRFVQGFSQYFLRALYITLWTLCLIVPGIIAFYAYAMTPFIMTDDPGLTAGAAIRRSKKMMKGHKMELFLLDLSFIGWSILAALTLNLGYLVLNPYTSAARAVFYRQLKENAWED